MMSLPLIVLHVQLPTRADSSHHTVLDIGFDETLVEVDESDGQASLNVRIVLSDQPSEFFDQPSELEITFSLFASTVDGSAGMRYASQFSQAFFIIIYFSMSRIKTMFSYLA